jgi:hypothetical protein
LAASNAIRRLNPQALADFIAAREKARFSEPFISTDRSPRRRVRVVDGHMSPTSELIDPAGAVVGYNDPHASPDLVPGGRRPL